MAPGHANSGPVPACMLYALYQTAADLMLPMRVWASVAGAGFALGDQSSADRWRAAGALCEMMSRASLSHRRPSFELDEITMGNRTVPVVEQEVLDTGFDENFLISLCRLTHPVQCFFTRHVHDVERVLSFVSDIHDSARGFCLHNRWAG